MQDGARGDASGFVDAALLAMDRNDVTGSVVLDSVAVNDSIFWNTMSTERNLPAGLVAAVQPFYCATLLFLTYGDPSRFCPHVADEDLISGRNP